MKHTINVAKSFPNVANGRPVHWFKIEVDMTETRAIELAQDIADRFPEALLTLTRWEHLGYEVGRFKRRKDPFAD